MRKKKILPLICIIGTGTKRWEKLESLIKLEPILAWLGYEDDVEWNDEQCSDGYYEHRESFILCKQECDGMEYHAHCGSHNYTQFLATDVDKIIEYVTSNSTK